MQRCAVRDMCRAVLCCAMPQERTELCRALLYAVVLTPHQLKPATVVDILQLLEQLVGKVKAAGGDTSSAVGTCAMFHAGRVDPDLVFLGVVSLGE